MATYRLRIESREVDLVEMMRHSYIDKPEFKSIEIESDDYHLMPELIRAAFRDVAPIRFDPPPPPPTAEKAEGER